MKTAATKNTQGLLHKIETIEKEVLDLKLTGLKKFAPSGKNIIFLKGILRSVEVTEKHIATAKKSLYSKAPL